MTDIFSKIYKYYRYRIFPKIMHIRGTARLSDMLNRAARRKLEKVDTDAEKITEEDFQNIIILDACRYDTYKRYKDDIDSRTSVGSATPEYIEKTFSDGDFSDYVYITANPHFHESMFEELTGRDPSEVFEVVFPTYDSGWNDEDKTVMPKEVVNDTLTAQKLYPDKKKIIHFMQPHHPFVGGGIAVTGFNILNDGHEENEWSLAEIGELKHEEVKEAYYQNLEFAMESVEKLCEELEGSTMITSDHGNLVGENGLYGHPRDSKAKVLRKVPADIRE